MTPLVLTIIIFAVALALSISVVYFFVATPLEKRRTLSRFEAIQKVAAPTADAYEQILREDVLSDNAEINRIFRRIPLMVKLHLYVKQSALNISVGRLLAFSLLPALTVLVLGLLLQKMLPLVLIIASGVGAIPFMIVGSFRKKRFAKFEELLPEAIDLLARSVRAGHAFTAGLEMIADEMSEPLSGEFRRMFEQQNLGMPIRDALQNLVLRMPLPDVRVFVTALIIQRETGGNLAEILDNLSHVVRERFKLMRHIQGVTAQGRLTRNILMAAPPGMGLYMYMMRPDYIMMLFTTPQGKLMLYYSIISQIIGLFLIQKIIKPKV